MGCRPTISAVNESRYKGSKQAKFELFEAGGRATGGLVVGRGGRSTTLGTFLQGGGTHGVFPSLGTRESLALGLFVVCAGTVPIGR